METWHIPASTVNLRGFHLQHFLAKGGCPIILAGFWQLTGEERVGRQRAPTPCRRKQAMASAAKRGRAGRA